MKLEELKRLTIRFQEEMISKISEAEEERTVLVEGLDIICKPKVFTPHTDTIFLAKCVEVNEEQTVLEPCSGSGFISIYLAKKAKQVWATDISNYAVDNVKENVVLYDLQDKIIVSQANLFPNTEQKFDIIVINPPYTDKEAKNIVEKTVWDEEHETVKQFLSEAPKHLAKDGYIYLSWGNFADYDLIEKLIKEYGYSVTEVKSISEKGEKDFIEYQVYKLIVQ